MARSDFYTLLSLDRWALIMGINPLHFNQLVSTNFQGESCGQPWFQHPWQSANRISREDISIAIQNAEDLISNDIGYFPLPKYTVDEMVNTTKLRNSLSYSSGYNVRAAHKSIYAHWGYTISGGIQAKAFIDTPRLVFSDEDGDGYDETVTATVATTVTDPDEIRAYYNGKSGDDAWEIRPITVSIAAGVATIVFKAWQIVNEDDQEGFNAAIIDADDPAVYLSNIDVYRVYIDPSTQLLMLWENLDDCVTSDDSCPECGNYTQEGCLHIRDHRLGEFSYKPATWNAVTGQFDSACMVIARDPDRCQISYLSGWRDMRKSRPSNDMDAFWERTIAYLAAALLDKAVCDCNNSAEFIGYWRDDLAKNVEERTFQMSGEQIAGKFGTTRGALYALRNCQAPGKRIGR